MSDLSAWTPRATPGLAALQGNRVVLEPFDAAVHGQGLFDAVGGTDNAQLWHWMPDGPFPEQDNLTAFLHGMSADRGWRTLAIRSMARGDILGMSSYMRLRESQGSAEIGCVAFGPRLKRTAEASEALALMAGHVFDLGYRRYEWKCDSLNLASRRAAERFGFRFEGIFRNDMVLKGRSRDTAWYSIVDSEWPALHAALEQWLSPDNFATDGTQKRTLESFRQP